ncbi:hypothetical protein [Thiothrix fructosivorans]|uniref:hypothetical protein n=1 Tax=Thiothrix fructosivorans TaxID=111770 RepID=UPI003FD77117
MANRFFASSKTCSAPDCGHNARIETNNCHSKVQSPVLQTFRLRAILCNTSLSLSRLFNRIAALSGVQPRGNVRLLTPVAIPIN